jgi:hypothetical protein
MQMPRRSVFSALLIGYLIYATLTGSLQRYLHVVGLVK